MKRRICMIINPASGVEEPILSYINKNFRRTGIAWDVIITKKKMEAKEGAQEAVQKGYDAVAVYGGDGTVSEVAQGLHGTTMPMGIIPGGTANVVAKELGIPTDSREALALLKRPKLQTKLVDMALSDEQPVLLGYVIGAWAEIVQKTKRKQKERFGQFAYGLSALQNLQQTNQTTYTLQFDKKDPINVQGAALFVTNVGNIGMQGVSLVPKMSMTDHYLDAVLIRSMDFPAIMSYLKSTILNQKPEGHLQHWKFKTLSLKVAKEQTVLCDDTEIDTTHISIRLSPHPLSVIVPSTIHV